MKIVIATVETEPARKEVIGSETRNSRFRENVAVPIQEITRLVHKELPWLSPTHLTIMGALEVTLGAIVAASREPNKPGGEKRKTAIAASLIFIGSIKDAFDGSLARMMAAENPKSVNFKKGAIYDVISDKTQEFSLAISRAFSATKRGSDIGALAALATAVTNPWPSISRAFSESLGKAVPESGKGVIGLIGTRPGRAVIGGVATLYPNPKGLPLQLAADVVMTGSNVITTFDRLRTAFGPGKVTRSSETMADAKTRLKVLGVVGAVTLGTSLFTLWRLNRRHKQERSEGLQANDMYKEWACYIEALRKRPDPLTRVKGMVTGFYWDTIGTQVAHGSGIFAGLSKFGDRMSG